MRAGSVGCHDVTNTCSTKTVMQLPQQSVPESCLSESQAQTPPPHPAHCTYCHSVDGPRYASRNCTQ